VEDLILSLAGALSAQVQQNKAQSLKEALLEQLHTTHDLENWFVPISVAVNGVIPEQAKWTDSHGGHSIGHLLNHPAFWNERNLQRFQGTTLLAYIGGGSSEGSPGG
jgi:hypothetical protein